MELTSVIKRDGTAVPFQSEKIHRAIEKANSEIFPEMQVSDAEIDEIISNIKTYFKQGFAGVEDIQDFIENSLMKMQKFELAKKYITYRSTRKLVRGLGNSTDGSVLGLVNRSNKDVMEENANKDALLNSTQRDLIAGEISKDISKRILLPSKIVEAHESAAIHFHDMDYFLQPMFNCCLVNIKDMLDNGTVMNGKLIESPKSFQVACTVMTQIIASVSSGQYGGLSVDVKHLGKFLRKSFEKYKNRLLNDESFSDLPDDIIEKLARNRTNEELQSGIQTIQYQINTLMTTNGQSPFVTLFLNLDPDDEYAEENAIIIEEILRQRYEGIKDENGHIVTPEFPKLIYVLDEHNCLKGGKYDYLTKLAVKCSARRMYPDYISAKKMRENYEGNVFSCMGCRSFLSPWKDAEGNYKWEGRFNQGVVSLNLPQIALLSQTDNGPDFNKFWQLMEERTALCFEALMCRHKALLGVTSDVSPIHWQYGGIARLKKGEKIDSLLKDGYSTISLGYIGLYETVKLMTGKSHTESTDFADQIMTYLREKTDLWKKLTGLGFGLYGTPAESLCYRFARIDKERFGDIPDVTDKGYYTNSYHVDVREKIDAFSKLRFESHFQKISSGGAISYIEIPNMNHNLDALEEVVRFIYDNIQYAEFNTKSDYCHVCNYEGEMLIKDGITWRCPNCGNEKTKKMTITRRVCGYLGGSNGFNAGKKKELSARCTHL